MLSETGLSMREAVGKTDESFEDLKKGSDHIFFVRMGWDLFEMAMKFSLL